MSANRHSQREPLLSEVLHDRLLLFGGVILPIAAALFESTTHFCARLFFDPFPSANHLVMFLLIPLSNFMAWNVKRRDMSRHFFFMALSSGMAAGIAVMYSVMFLPILGLSLLFSLAFGFGLLGLAPLIAIPCTMRSGALVCNAATKQTYFDPHQVKHIGHLIILVMVVAIELPSTMTRINLGLAADPASAARGVTWLRKYGSQEVMLRACYERSGRATDILGSIYESAHPLNIDHARRIFYRVTGKPFNSVPIPAAARATIQHAGLATDVAGVNAKVDDEFDLDGDIAGETVSGVSRGLSASACSVEGAIDPDALVSKIKWSIDFQNASRYDREARAKVLLPRGGVVTAASVVVDGMERNATLMLRGLARVKYVRSVAATVKKKDPLLVSTSGPDEILLQCFPVQPGKPLRVNLTIVCPLTLDEKEKGVLGFPIVVERNFQFSAPVQISLESKRQLSSDKLKTVSFQRNVIDQPDSQPLASNVIASRSSVPKPQVPSVNASRSSTSAVSKPQVWNVNGSRSSSSVVPDPQVSNVNGSRSSIPAVPKPSLSNVIASRGSDSAVSKPLVSNVNASRNSIPAVPKPSLSNVNASRGSDSAVPKPLVSNVNGSRSSIPAVPKPALSNVIASLSSTSAVPNPPLENASASETVFGLNGTIEHPVLDSISAFVQADRDRNCQSVYCRDKFRDPRSLVRRNIRFERYVQPKKLSIIIDGSENMRGTIEPVSKGLSNLPAGIPIELIFVGDETRVLCSGDTKSGDPQFEQALVQLPKLELIGGQDDSPALTKSLTDAAKAVDHSILWIHGSQPISEPGQSVIRPLVEANRVLIYDFAVAAGPAQILNGVYTGPSFVRVTRAGSIEKDLSALGEAWSSDPTDVATASSGIAEDALAEYSIEQPAPSGQPITGYETDSSLAQLYANQKIVNDLNKPVLEELTKVASDYHIVSPVSSAVVTEDDSTEIKTVNTAVAPEADTWLLLIVVAGVVVFVIRRKRLQEASV